MATASAALASQPASGALSAVSGVVEASAAGPLFAVVSPGKAWAVCGSYHEAFHHASMIRHSAAVCTSHVRCTPAFAEQVRSGSLKSFIEIDGWAVTSNEAEARGLEFLRDAMDRARARSQLISHYRRISVQRVDALDRASAGNGCYVEARIDDCVAPQIIAAAADEQDAVQKAHRRLSGAPQGEPQL